MDEVLKEKIVWEDKGAQIFMVGNSFKVYEIPEYGGRSMFSGSFSTFEDAEARAKELI